MDDQAIIVGAGRCRLDDDLIDDRAELRASLSLVDGLGRQRVIEAIDDLSPGLDRARVKLGNLSGVLERGELALELLALAAGAVERHQPRVGCRRIGSGADAVDELLDLHLRPRQALREVALGMTLGLAQARALSVVFGERMAYDFGPQQLALEALEDAPLDFGDRHEEAVAARPALAHGRTAEPVLADDRVTAAAAAATQQSRQQPGRRYALDSRQTDGRLLAGLGARPGLVVDDAQVRRRHLDPGARRIGSRDPAPGLGVLHHGDAVVDQAPDVDRVLQQPRAALRVAIDGRRAPLAAEGRLDAVAVEAARDVAGGRSIGKFAEDTAHDLGLGLVDRTQAGLELRAVELADDLVAVGAAAGAAAFLDAATRATLCFHGQILEEERVHRALQTHMQFADLALGYRDQFYAGKHEALEDASNVLLITRQTIERFSDDNFELPVARSVEQTLCLGAVPERGTGNRIIGEVSHHGPAMAVGELVAQS